MGFERKLAALSFLRPDIAILSEVARPERLRSQLPVLEGMPIVWVGNKANKGLAVVSFTGSKIELILDTDQTINSLHLFMSVERSRFACSPRGITMTERKA
jgi:hypothetical protein